MVNFRGPSVIQQDDREYPLTPKYETSKGLLYLCFDSGSCEVLAHTGWTVHVGRQGGAIPLTHDVSNNDNWHFTLHLYLAGSSSPLLATNGVLFGGDDRTAGQ
jgi:hypothetical protein